MNKNAEIIISFQIIATTERREQNQPPPPVVLETTDRRLGALEVFLLSIFFKLELFFRPESVTSVVFLLARIKLSPICLCRHCLCFTFETETTSGFSSSVTRASRSHRVGQLDVRQEDFQALCLKTRFSRKGGRQLLALYVSWAKEYGYNRREPSSTRCAISGIGVSDQV